jgi:hypothetical protein
MLPLADADADADATSSADATGIATYTSFGCLISSVVCDSIRPQ